MTGLDWMSLSHLKVLGDSQYLLSKPCLCIDYRKLNELAVPDEFPLPRQTDILHTLEGSQFLTTLDMLAGFTQLKVKEKDCPKTAFRCHRGLYQFKQLPFGFRNGPSVFLLLIAIANL